MNQSSFPERITSFVGALLVLLFAGVVLNADGGRPNLSLGEILFMEKGGRPGHEGLFPIQAENPLAESELPMRVTVYSVEGGVTGARYTFLDENGATLAGAPLTSMNPSDPTYPNFLAIVKIPKHPFKISISAVGKKPSDTLTSVSKFYRPSTMDVRLDPTTALLKKGQSVPLVIHLRSDVNPGNYQVNLRLPAELKGTTGPWNVFVPFGQTVDVPTSITAPTSAPAFSHFKVVVDVKSTNPAITPASASMDFEVE